MALKSIAATAAAVTVATAKRTDRALPVLPRLLPRRRRRWRGRHGSIMGIIAAVSITGQRSVDTAWTSRRKLLLATRLPPLGLAFLGLRLNVRRWRWWRRRRPQPRRGGRRPPGKQALAGGRGIAAKGQADVNTSRVIGGSHAPAAESHSLHRNGEGRLDLPPLVVSPPISVTATSPAAPLVVPDVVLSPPPIRAWRAVLPVPAFGSAAVRRATDGSSTRDEFSLDTPKTWFARAVHAPAAAVAAVTAVATTTNVTTPAATATAADFSAFDGFRKDVLRREQVLSVIIDSERRSVRRAGRTHGPYKVGETS